MKQPCETRGHILSPESECKNLLLNCIIFVKIWCYCKLADKLGHNLFGDKSMKHNCLILIIVIVFCVLLAQSGCQEPSKSAPEAEPAISPAKAQAAEPAKEGPRIKFEKVYQDFRDIGPGTSNLCEFKFTNIGDELLKITRVSKTCGCTPYTLAKKEYAPGESGTLKVKFISDKRPGLALKRLYVYSNDETDPKVSLTLRAQIALKVDYKPNRMKLLLKDENAGCPKITLNSVDGREFSIIGFKSTANSITADYDQSLKATSFVLQPKADIKKLQKSLNGHININLTHPECKTILIPYNTLPQYTINPSVVSVFNVEPEKPVTRELWLLDNYNEDFKVESTSSEKGFVKVLSQEKVGRRYKFKLELMPPGANNNPRVFTDKFIVNIEGGEKVEVVCRGFYSK